MIMIVIIIVVGIIWYWNKKYRPADTETCKTDGHKWGRWSKSMFFQSRSCSRCGYTHKVQL